MTCDHDAQIRRLSTTESVRSALRMGNHPAGRPVAFVFVGRPAAAALRDACEARDAAHENGGGA